VLIILKIWEWSVISPKLGYNESSFPKRNGCQCNLPFIYLFIFKKYCWGVKWWLNSRKSFLITNPNVHYYTIIMHNFIKMSEINDLFDKCEQEDCRILEMHENELFLRPSLGNGHL
jgi:hypothetical protein